MSQFIDTTADGVFETESVGVIKRTAVLAYGVFAYIIGVSGLLWLILAVGGLAPMGFGPVHASSVAGAVAINLGLILLFGVQHSVMARAGFKQWLTRVIPSAAERATYLLMSGLVTVMAIALWQSLPGTVWVVQNPVAQMGLWAAYALGWGYLFMATFVTNHFELMGLRQVYLYFANKSYTSLPFTRKYMYRYSRHPMMLGFLIGMWAVPVMTVTHFAMSLLFTVYIGIGVALEERDLLKRFGDTYRRYKKDIATFVPGMY